MIARLILALVLAATAAAPALVASSSTPAAGEPAAIEPERPAQPNIVFVLTDDQSVDALPQGMPYLNSRPGGHWVEFPNAFVNTPLCCPSRATMMSGQYSHHTGVRNNQEGQRFNETSTIATWLQGAGYRTGYAGKYLNHWPFGEEPYVPPGWSDWFAIAGPVRYYDYSIYDNGTLRSFGTAETDYLTDVLAGRAERFIDESAGDRPFFLTVAPYAPHAPRTPANRHRRAEVTVTRPPNFNELDVSDKPAWVQERQLQSETGAAQWDSARAQSFRTLRAVDDLVRRVFDRLAATGELDDTVIVVQTDNGFLFGEHRLVEKGCIYEECIRTPTLVRYPWVESRVETGLVSNADLAPTFAEIAGIVPPAPVDGVSWLGLIEGRAPEWTRKLLFHALGGRGPGFWAIRTERWKYSELDTGERELYEMLADPYELENVAGHAAYAEIQAGLAADLAALKAAPARRLLPSLSVADAVAHEGSPGGGEGTLAVPVSLSLATDRTVTVEYRTSDGSAVDPGDYSGVSGSLRFDPGVTMRTIDVPVVDDAVAEPDEAFHLTLEAPAEALIEDDEAVATILNDDDTPAIEVSDARVAEGDEGESQATFAVSLTVPATDAVTANFATADGTARAGSDYGAASGVVTFEPGQDLQLVAVPVLGDSEGELDEEFLLDLTEPVNASIGRGRGVGTIQNDDPLASLSIDDAAVGEGDAGATAATFTVSLAIPSEERVTVDYATESGTAGAGEDYWATAGTVVLDPGETVRQVSVPVHPDRVHEIDEWFRVTLSNATAPVTDADGIGTILDDDPVPSLTVDDASVVEGHSGTASLTFSVTLSNPSAFAATASFATANDSARAGHDYHATSGTVTFAPGQTLATVTVAVVGDTAFEANERLYLNLSSPSGASIARGRGVGTIVNDDSK